MNEPIIDAAATREAAEDGMRRAHFLTGEEWKEEVYQAACVVARKYLEFCADEIWQQYGRVGDGKKDNGSGLVSVTNNLHLLKNSWVHPSPGGWVRMHPPLRVAVERFPPE